MSNKLFAERLNKELDELGLPEPAHDRTDAFAKLIKIPRFKAEALLNGLSTQDLPLVALVAEELEVSVDWLLGKSDSRKN